MNSVHSLTPAELAYIAGFFDGEGCVQIFSTGRSFSMSISIGQVDPRPLRYIRDRFGGVIRLNLAAQGKRRRLLYWRLYAENAKLFLLAVLPYLINKKQEATIAIEFQNLRRSKSRSKYGDQLMFENVKLLKTANF